MMTVVTPERLSLISARRNPMKVFALNRQECEVLVGLLELQLEQLEDTKTAMIFDPGLKEVDSFMEVIGATDEQIAVTRKVIRRINGKARS